MQVKIPVVSSSGIKHLNDNFDWARNKLFPPVANQPAYQVNHPHNKKPSVVVKVDSDEDDYDDVDDILTSAELAKQSRLKRWKGEEINGLSGEDNTSKWSKVCFDDVPPLSDEIDSSWNVAERAAGAVQFLSGAAEAALGFVGGVATAETGIGPVLGAFLFERGVDNFGTGLDRLLSGSPRDTQLNHILTDSGLSESDASLLENSLDFVGTGGVGGLVKYSKFFKGAESVIQVTIKHPLAELSVENVIRLTDEIGLNTSKDQLILWSGLGRGEGVKLAMEYAHLNGGVTLEMTQGGSWLNNMNLFGLESPYSYREATQIWEAVSARMIQQASGQVRSLIGQVRPGSIYRAEQSEILMNDQIAGLDELYLKPRFIFGRN